MELTNLIPDLLYKHNCVILPDFGGFIANFKASEHKTDRFLVSPARKIIAFNQSLSENDGLLISALAKSKKIPYTQAEKEVYKYIEFIRERLAKYKNFEFKNVGTFYLNSEDNLLFVPYQGLNFLEKSFGLPDVKVKPLFDHAIEPTVVEGPKVVRLKTERKATGSGTLLRVAASAIIVLMVAGFGTMYLNENRSLDRMAGLELNKPSEQMSDSDRHATASIVPVQSHDDVDGRSELHPEEQMEAEENPVEETIVEEEYTPAVPEVEEQVVETPKDNTAIEAPRAERKIGKYRSAMTERNYFHVMIGEFDNEAQAVRWQKRYQNKAYSAEIIDDYKQGKYLLSLEFFTKEEHAIAFQREVRVSERRKTWILELKGR